MSTGQVSAEQVSAEQVSAEQVSAEQVALRDAVRGLLARRSGRARVRRAIEMPRGYDEALWRALCTQIGVAGLSIPEAFGGLGAELVETHLVLEELGRDLTPSPLLGSGVLAAQLLIGLGDDDASARLLPGVADGTTVAAVCWSGTRGDWDPEQTVVTVADGELSGSTRYVLDGDTADVLLVVAAVDGEVGVYEVDPIDRRVVRTHTPSMDPTRRLAAIDLQRAPARRVGGPAGPALAHALDAVAVAQTAEQVGAMTRLLDLTVEYTKTRVQFGRPIGSFQALKHRMADLHVLVEAARSASYAAVDGTIAPAVAAAYCGDAFLTVAAEAIQLHGGIAITWEHDAHLYFKRAHAGTQLFGTPDHRRARLAGALGL